MYEMVKTDKFVEFDGLVAARPGKTNFYRIMQQLFLFRYFPRARVTRSSEEITRRQFEIALGIQQVRWMVDTENVVRYEDLSRYQQRAFDKHYETMKAKPVQRAKRAQEMLRALKENPGKGSYYEEEVRLCQQKVDS